MKRARSNMQPQNRQDILQDESIANLEAALRQSYVDISEEFRSQSIPANEIPVPADKIRSLLTGILHDFKVELNKKQKYEIILADSRLKDEYEGDWVMYRDARLSELESENSDLDLDIPNHHLRQDQLIS
jgi:hypothetical protein